MVSSLWRFLDLGPWTPPEHIRLQVSGELGFDVSEDPGGAGSGDFKEKRCIFLPRGDKGGTS